MLVSERFLGPTNACIGGYARSGSFPEPAILLRRLLYSVPLRFEQAENKALGLDYTASDV